MIMDEDIRKEEPMAEEEQFSFDEDELVIADMSDLERQPLLIPRFDHMYKRKRGEDSRSQAQPQQPVHLEGEERRAMIKGTLAAAFLVLGVIAAAFAGLIFLMISIWG